MSEQGDTSCDRDELRESLDDAISMSAWLAGDRAKDLIDAIFADVAGILRRHAGMSSAEADLALADAKGRAEAAAEETFGCLVDVDAAVGAALDVVAERFGDDANSTNQGGDSP